MKIAILNGSGQVTSRGDVTPEHAYAMGVHQVPMAARTLTGMSVSLGMTLDDAISVVVQVNGVDVAITDTIPTGSTATRIVTGFSVPVADGDLVSVKVVAAGTSSKAGIAMHVSVLGSVGV